MFGTPPPGVLCSVLVIWKLGTNIEHQEEIQKKFTRLITDISTLLYGARLKSLNLTTLAERRMRGDLTLVLTRNLSPMLLSLYASKSLWDSAFTCVTRTSNRASCPLLHNPQGWGILILLYCCVLATANCKFETFNNKR